MKPAGRSQGAEQVMNDAVNANPISLNRKQTKIEFLSQENQQLREQIVGLQNVVRLNKEALRIAMHQSAQLTSATTPTRDAGSYYSHQDISISNNKNQAAMNNSILGSAGTGISSENPRALSLVLQAMYSENEALLKINERLTEERNFAQSKALINEQISEASQKHEIELIQDLEERVRNLTQKNKEQEQTIYTLEKTRPDYDQVSGIVIKYRDVISLSDQTVRLHDENERLSTIVLKQTKQITDFKADRIDLAKINMQLTNEVLRLKSILASPHGKTAYTSSKGIEQPQVKQNIRGARDLIKIHQKLMRNEHSDPDGEGDSDAEDMQSQANDDCMDAPIQDKSEESGANALGVKMTKQVAPPGMNIPKLNLAKALQIQEINAKKSTMQQLQKAQGSDIGALSVQLQKSESDLVIAKKNLQREMLWNKTLLLENENLKRVNSELEARNETLANSHQMYETRWQSIFTAFHFYRDFYKSSSTTAANQATASGIAAAGILPNTLSRQRTNRSLHGREKSAYGHDFLNTSSQYAQNLNRSASAAVMHSTQQLSQHAQHLAHHSQFCSESQGAIEQDRQVTFSSKLVTGSGAGKSKQVQIQEQPSILQMNAQELKLDEEIFRVDPAVQKEFARNYLLSIAKDIYGIFNKYNMSPRKAGQLSRKSQNLGEFRLKRSLSNPLDYSKENSRQPRKDLHLDRSDIGVRNYTTMGAAVTDFAGVSDHHAKYKDLNDMQEILIQFTDNTDEKGSANYFHNAAHQNSAFKPQQAND